ncbi:hypothetical protein FHT40_004495 [Mycolicibacterium sp. BK556]|uniref:hypothetical protein n=1 Tax=unclassified Mycolicibacterium TaxID=2636767 RepID=UPI001612CB42|nr:MULTISPECIES: hypothetical protein [unclassified Mycolicibacterium]MBB3604817.1 hypothetical protein [Mycolicibacterium sp. BK556]MBB3634470.1 hypothetical protein [Mycolicibacterium sp. BK607]MBB3752047.1 hypothetical protein [Mycolicibacterium sp. BK634]
MPSRWLRLSRSPREDNDTQIPAELTSAFLDMERRLGIAEQAVEIATALQHHASLTAEWATARDRAYAATAQYLAVAAPDSTNAGPRAPLAEVARSIDTAMAGLDDFYHRHRRTLDGATGAALSARTQADQALAAAIPALQRLAALDPEFADYPSVRAARELVESTRTETQAVVHRGDIAATGTSAQRLQRAIAALDQAVAAAPGLNERTTRTMASVRTRLDAITNRAGTIDTAYSALLREFNVASSEDLDDNKELAQTHLDVARTCIDRAARELGAHHPEQAAALAAQAREELARAEGLVDAVTDRLGILRALRADPSQPERDIRFRIRDAQRLAVDRNATAEWGTALDAQVPRVDRIVEALRGPHPDYWRYHVALDEVSQFVANIVNRIRQQSATR